MSDALLQRLAHENPVSDLPALPFEQIAARIEASELPRARTSSPTRAAWRPWSPTRTAWRPRRTPRAAWATAAAALVVVLVLVAHRTSAPPRDTASPADPAVAAVASHFAVLRTGAAHALPSSVADRITRALHGPAAQTRRVVSSHGTIWIAVATNGRLCITLVSAGGTETVGISCGDEAEAIRKGVRLAGRLSAGTGVVAGILPDRLARAAHTTIRTAGGHHRRLAVTDNVYAATVSPAAAPRATAD